MAFEPELPTFRRSEGRDGKLRLYLLASNELDIEFMVRAAGLIPAGIRFQNDAALRGYYRIIQAWEEKHIRQVFDLE